MDDQISDDMLIAAARKRILSELGQSGGGGGVQKLVNNIYGAQQGGGDMGGGGGGGLFDSLSGGDQGQGGEDPFDYNVDITRRDLEEINPLTGKPAGWTKTVHRWRGSKKKAPMGPMVQEPPYRE